MKRKMTLTILAISMAVAICGAVLLFVSCDGSCGAANHGGMLTFVCFKTYFPRVWSITLIVSGGIGIVAATILFSYSEKLCRQRLTMAKPLSSTHGSVGIDQSCGDCPCNSIIGGV